MAQHSFSSPLLSISSYFQRGKWLLKVSHDVPVFCGGLNEVERDGRVRGGGGGEVVDVENLQVVIWEDFSKKFCVIRPGSLDCNGANGIS